MKNIGISAHFIHLLKFRNFVFATEVTIFSDHNPLMYLRECAPKSAKLTRWALGLQEFMHADSNICHTSVCSATVISPAVVIMPPPYGGRALSDTTIRTPVCLSHGAADEAIGTLAACSLATARRPPQMCGLRTRLRTDVDPPRFLLPSYCHRRGAYRLAAPGRYLVSFPVVMRSIAISVGVHVSVCLSVCC